MVAAALGGCATSAAAQDSIDPLTCYLDSEGSSIEPDSVTLRCGGGVLADIDVTTDRQAADTGTSVGEWEVIRVSTGTSTIGSMIVRVATENSGQTCTYHRDLADPAQDSTTDCPASL